MPKLKILVACEESQVVCNAFRVRGHEAYSCDILPTRGEHPEWHIQDDVMKHLNDSWDLMIAHPECTYMANSGVTWMKNKDGTLNASRHLRCINAGTFLEILLGENCPVHSIPKVCIENPIPHKYAYFPWGAIHRKYDQIIHPWQFGHMEQKPTCLWLKNLPLLKETNNVKEETKKLPANIRQRIHYMPPSETRKRDRSKTFQGIADAMAVQWG